MERRKEEKERESCTKHLEKIFIVLIGVSKWRVAKCARFQKARPFSLDGDVSI
jgi:hypothetical protein